MKRIQWRAAIVGAATTGLLAAASGQSCIAWADQGESAGVITSSATVYEALPPDIQQPSRKAHRSRSCA